MKHTLNILVIDTPNGVEVTGSVVVRCKRKAYNGNKQELTEMLIEEQKKHFMKVLRCEESELHLEIFERGYEK